MRQFMKACFDFYKAEKGALSIFVVIWIPIVMIGTVYLFNLLTIEQERNQSIKLALMNSDVALSTYSDYLMDHYGLMAYLHTDQFDKNIEISLEKNRLIKPVSIKTNPLGLNRTAEFAMAAREASTVLIPLGLYDATFNKVTNEAMESEKKEMDRAFKERDDEILKRMHANRQLNRLNSIQHLSYSINSVREAKADWESERSNLIRDYGDHQSAIKEMYQAQLSTNKMHLDEISQKVTALSQADEEVHEETYQKIQALVDMRIIEASQKPPSIINQINALIKRLTQLKNNQSPIDTDPVQLEATDWHLNLTDDWTELQKWQVKEYFIGVFKSHDPGTPRNIDPLKNKDSRKSGFLGEIEYLIAGNNNDTRNFQQVKLQIFAMRELTNLTHILTNAQKRTQITQLTVALPVPWNMVAYSGIVLLWSGAESYVDVMRLVDGEGLSIIKSNEEWFLSLDQLMSGNWLEKQADTKKESNFLDPQWYYQDYLRLLLYMKPFSEVVERAMTLVDLNLKLDTHSKYRLKDFARGHDVAIEWETDRFNFTNHYRQDNYEDE